MDFTESTKVVYNRIQQLDPENVTRIIGYLLLQEHCDQDMIRLAFGPDTLIKSLIQKAKSQLGQNNPAVSASITVPQMNQASVAHLHKRAPGPYWDLQMTADQQQVNNLEFAPPGYSDSTAVAYHLINQMKVLNLEDQLESDYSACSDFLGNHYNVELTPGARTMSLSLHDFPVKIFAPNPNEVANEDHAFSPQSLEKLEFELIELLRSRKGLPVSISSLPMMYFEKYGKPFQAERYLTESQRHGKAGHSLTKLLARLKQRIQVIDRPHGQHSVILAEDVPKYLDHAAERSETSGIVAVSKQIYLTFPAESNFTEQDVFNYFNKTGPVQDVRIPYQKKRMFGFVTFVHAETVKQVLAKGNPHFVCGAHVLVKPYREKSRLADKKFMEKVQQPMYHKKHFVDGDPELQSIVPRVYSNSKLLKKQLMAQHERALEFERCLSGFELAPEQPFTSHRSQSKDEFKLTDGDSAQADFLSAECFHYLLDILNGGSTSDDNVRHTSAKYSDWDSSLISLES
ncbi:hypothetical protein SLE2022_119430 [Rubroshorea leprosula]